MLLTIIKLFTRNNWFISNKNKVFPNPKKKKKENTLKEIKHTITVNHWTCTLIMQTGNIPGHRWGCSGNTVNTRSSNVSNRGHSLDTALILTSGIRLIATDFISKRCKIYRAHYFVYQWFFRQNEDIAPLLYWQRELCARAPKERF